MNCPKCGMVTVKLGVVSCLTGDAERRGCPRCRGIWYQQLAGQSCLGHDATLEKNFGRVLRLAVCSVKPKMNSMTVTIKTWCGAVMSHEFRDEAAVKWLKLVAPDLLVKMPATQAVLPQFEDHENICSMEMFSAGAAGARLCVLHSRKPGTEIQRVDNTHFPRPATQRCQARRLTSKLPEIKRGDQQTIDQF